MRLQRAAPGASVVVLVVRVDDFVGEHRRLQGGQEGVRAGVVPPPARIDQQASLQEVEGGLESLGLRRLQLELAEAKGVAHAQVVRQGRVGADEKRAQLALAQPGQARAVGFVQTHATAMSAFCNHGHTSGRQRVQVAQDGPARNLELVGQAGAGAWATVLKHEDDADKSVRAHAPPSYY